MTVNLDGYSSCIHSEPIFISSQKNNVSNSTETGVVFTSELYKRFDGAVSITVVLKESENKVEGLSARLRVRAQVKPFYFFYFLLSQRSRNFFAVYMFAEKCMF